MLTAASRGTRSLPDPRASATTAAAERTTRRVVCALSGLIAAPSFHRQVEEWIVDEAVVDSCDWHRQTPRGVIVRWPAV